ncbi:MAG: efflux RND transporter periplasmic adaptor subunit [Planctomycetota bacterium]
MRDRVRTGGARLLLPLLAAACAKEATAPVAPPPPVVVVAPAVQQDVPVYIESVAQTVAEDTVDIRARVEGVLLTMQFEEGKPVKKGALLFTIDPQEYEAALLGAKAKLAKGEADLKLAKEQVTVRAAEAAVAQSKARLRKAETDVARLTPLAAADAVPQQDLDNAEAALDVAKADLDAADANLTNAKLLEQVGVLLATAEVEGAKADVADAELNLGYCTIASPLDGLIGRKDVSVGNLVGRGESTLLASVSSIDPMRASFTISEQDYIRLSKAEAEKKAPPPFHLTLADGAAYPLEGTFVVTERQVDVRTGTLVLEARFPNPKGLLKPGQFGRVKAVAETIKDAVVIPQRAVMEQQSAKIAYVVKEDKTVELRTVTLGERFENGVVVREGIKAGENVIVDGQMKTRPGQPVNPMDEKAAEAAAKAAKPEGN